MEMLEIRNIILEMKNFFGRIIIRIYIDEERGISEIEDRLM